MGVDLNYARNGHTGTGSSSGDGWCRAVRVEEIDRKLDTECRIALTQISPWFELAGKMNIAMPVQIFVDSYGASLRAFVDRRKVPGKYNSMVASRSSAESDSYFSVSETVTSDVQSRVISMILETPSVVSSGAYILGNELHIPFRFHSSYSERVNEALMLLPEIRKESRLIYFGKSRGLLRVLSNMAREVPLKVIRYRSGTDVAGSEERRALASAEGSLTEIEKGFRKEAGARLVTYSEKGLGSEFTAVSPEDGVYELTTSENFFGYMASHSSAAGIPRISLLLRLSESRYEITTVMPNAAADAFLSILYRSPQSDSEGGVTVDMCAPFSDSLASIL